LVQVLIWERTFVFETFSAPWTLVDDFDTRIVP
jgi:hypothetical protein